MAYLRLPAPADPLGEALHFLRMSGSLCCRSEFTAPWGVTLPAIADSLMFHVVVNGECWLDVEGAAAQRLQPGDFALVPHGDGHRLSSAPGVAAPGLFDLPRTVISDRYEILQHGAGGAPATAICGVVSFDHPAALQLIALLPRTIVVTPGPATESEWMRSTLSLMAAEARALRAGGETVITRLADVLVIQAIRSWIARDPVAHTGWLGALRDKQLGRAIAKIHRDPAHGWTVTALASEAAMSRSAFAARFTAAVGEPVMQYVTRWRMHLALSLLKEEGGTLATVAERLGYQSESAFSRAFRRYIGQSPGEVRRAATQRPKLAGNFAPNLSV